MALSEKLRHFVLAWRGADSLFFQAERLHRAGQGALARRCCEMALQKRPDHAAALHLSGVFALEEGRFDDAVRILKSSEDAGNPDIQLQYDLGEACRLSGNWAKATSHYRRALEGSPGVVAARLGLAESCLRIGENDNAGREVDHVLATDPDNLRALMLSARLALAKGESSLAERQARRVLAQDPGDKEALGELAKALLLLDRLDETESVLRALPLASDIDAQGTLVKLISTRVKRGLVGNPERHSGVPAVSGVQAPAQPMISVVICSVNEKKFDTVCANYAERLAGERHEIIGIHDARSLCEGYNRGASRASGDIVIFSHDDIEILTPDFAARLKQHLRHHDVVGPCGTSRLVMGSWMGAGWPHLHGLVAHHFPPGHEQGGMYRVLVLDTSEEDATGCLQALDGMFMAAKRVVVENCPFDEKTFDGFHLYDLDFTFSAYLAGYDIAVFRDITMVHYTYADAPGYEEAFARQCSRFEAKYREELSKMPGYDVHFIPAAFETKDEVGVFCRDLMAFRRQHAIGRKGASAAPLPSRAAGPVALE